MPTIALERLPYAMPSNTLGTDALNAINSIDGASGARIAHESEDRVFIEYDWDEGAAPIDQAAVHLAGFGLRRVVV